MIKHIEINNKHNNVLRGYLDLPDNSTKVVVMFHGYTGNKTEHNGFFRTMSRKLSQMNIASLRLDYSCNGESDGEFYEFNFDTALDDAKLMIDYAFNLPKVKDVILLGFSMGGAIASLVCNYRKVRGLMLWSPSGDLALNLRKKFDAAPKLENGNIYSPGFELNEDLVKTMEKYDFYSEAEKFLNPVYIIHGRSDKAVDYLRGVEYAVKFPNANLHLIDKAGHGYDELDSSKELLAKSLNFLKNL